MAIHQVSKRDWDPMTWKFPLIHNFNYGFGLSVDDELKNSTIVPWFFQDNALVDYELIKTNPENADFATVAYPNVMAGSYIPKVLVHKTITIYPGDPEIDKIMFNTMEIGTSMLNRLDAFDKKTGDRIQDILELQSETTDEQCGPLYIGATGKLFEGGGVQDLDFAKVPFLTTDGQMESVAFDKELFFDAMSYYTNREMLKLVTQRMKRWDLFDLDIPHGRTEVNVTRTVNTPSLCKFQHPYTYCGELFHLPQSGGTEQYHLAGQTTGVEHLTVKGYIRFYEFNPDFNFARA